MIRFEAKDILRIVYSLVLILVPAAILAVLLHPQGPLLPIVLFIVLTNGLYFLKSRVPGRKSMIFTVLLYLVLAAGVVVMLIDVIITPYSAYLTWFQLVREGSPQGAISYVIVMTMIFFSSIVAGSCYSSDSLKPAWMIVFISLSLFSLVFQSIRVFFLSLLLLGVILFITASRGYRGRNVFRAFGSSFSVLLVSLALALILSGSGEPKGSRVVDLSLSPALREVVISVFPDFPILYGIPGYGYSFESRGLGKAPVLSQRAIFEVSGRPGKNIYLRTSVYNIYDGDAWSISPEILERAKNRIDVQFGTPFPGESSDAFDVTVLSDFYAMIPHTLQTSAFNIKRRRANDLQYGNRNAGYLLDQPLLSGETVTVYERPSGLDGTGELRNPSLYLNLPESVSSELMGLARTLGREDVMLTADSIRSYLSSEFTYTLSTNLPKGKDLIEYFLFDSKIGYCVHFASAFTILARMNGIPARYVTGFLTRIPPSQSTTRISGYSAHAWPEIWVPGQGWTIVEATPPVQYSEGYDGYGDDEYYRSLEDEYTTRQLRELLGSRSLPDGSGPENDTGTGGRLLFLLGSASWFTIFLAISAGAGAIVLVLRLARSGDPLKQIQRLSGRSARKLERAGVLHPSKIGWLRWGEEVARLQSGLQASDIARADVDGFTALVIRTYFGSHVPDRNDVGQVSDFVRRLKYRQLRTVSRLERAGSRR